MIRPKNKIELLIPSGTKHCERLNKQTHAKPQGSLEIKLTKPIETLSYKLSINVCLDSKWMVGLTRFGVYNSVFNVTEKKKKFELFADEFEEFSFEEQEVEAAEIFGSSKKTPKLLQHDIVGPLIIKAIEKLGSEK